MSLTLRNDSPPNYTVEIEGTMLFDLVSTQEKTYTFKFKEQPGGIPDYNFIIPKEEAEKNGSIDPGKVFIWCLKKLKEYICSGCK